MRGRGLEVGRYRSGYAVFEDGVRMSGVNISQEKAWDKVDVIRRRRRAGMRRRRPCLVCGHPFMSEGAHHRLCAACRTSRGDAQMGMG